MPERTYRHRAAAVIAATAAALLLAGAGCPLYPPPPPESGNPTPAPGAGSDRKPVTWIVGTPTFTFAHVQPGVRSEFYVDLQTGPGLPSNTDPNDPGTSVTISLDGPGVLGDRIETRPFVGGEDMRFTWSINRFGDYTAEGDVMQGTQSIYHFSGKAKVK